MSDNIVFTIDGREIQGRPGQTIIEAADQNGIYIPRLCYHRELSVHGSCRMCTVMVNGRPQTACTQPIAGGMVVESETAEVADIRKSILEMMFVEGNHFCMFCEASGDCELQALAYRLGVTVPRYPYQYPPQDVDASHPDIFIDRNRCILCGRCVRASKELDGKNVFGFVGRGHDKKVAVNGAALSETDAAAVDRAVELCPVGAIMRKRVGYAVPVGKRKYDHQPIGSDIEAAGRRDVPAPSEE